jgi:hypothetical protein
MSRSEAHYDSIGPIYSGQQNDVLIDESCTLIFRFETGQLHLGPFCPHSAPLNQKLALVYALGHRGSATALCRCTQWLMGVRTVWKQEGSVSSYDTRQFDVAGFHF